MTKQIGYIGLDHHHCAPYLDSIAQLDATVTAACEPSGELTPRQVDGLDDGVPFYSDPVELLDSEAVDVVWLTLSNADTPPVIEAALERDVDVYTEKPAARTAADLEPVRDAAAASDATVAVSYTWRGHPIAQRLRTLSGHGFYGDVTGFDARFVASQLATRNTDHYLFDATASRGGIVQWLGVHWIDLVPWLLDDPVARVSAQTRHGTDAVDVEDGATVQFETASGALGSLTCGFYLREGRYDTRVDVYGTGGSSAWDPMGSEFGFDEETTLDLDDASGEWAGTPHRSITYEYEDAPGYGGRWGLGFIEESLAAMDGDIAPPATLDDALEVLRVLDAVYESAESGEWVDVARN